MSVQSHSQVVYTPRLKKVLKSYQQSALNSLNGPDWVQARASSSSSASSVSPLTSTPPAPSNDSKPSHQSYSSDKVSSKPNRGVSSSAGSGCGSSSTSVSVSSAVCSSVSNKPEPYDPFLAPPPFPIQQPPIFTPPDQNRYEKSETVLEGETISCFTVGGEKRLCLPQILTTVLREFSLPQINSVCDELQIFCSRCTNDQLEVLKVTGIIPASAPSCGLITKTDAERLCSSLLHSNPPKSSFSSIDTSKDKHLVLFKVYHECFGKCIGLYVQSLYVQPYSPCIECLECHGLFAPQKFVCHAHRSRENRTCHWGFDSSNWRHYLLLYQHDKLDLTDLQHRLDEMKARFQFKRKIAIPTNAGNSHSEITKRLKIEETGGAIAAAASATAASGVPSGGASGLYSYPSYLFSPYAWAAATDPAMLMYWYPYDASANSNNSTLAARLSAFKPWSPSSVGNGKHLSQNISHVMPQGYNTILPTHKFSELPPILQTSDKIASKRLDRYCQPNLALAPLSHQLSTASIAHQNSLKSNDKLKSRKDGINFDEDSLSSTTTFSSENSNLSDEETHLVNKSSKLFSNLEMIIDEHNLSPEFKTKIISEVENIIRKLGKHNEQQKITNQMPNKKVVNGITSSKRTKDNFCTDKCEDKMPSAIVTKSPEVSQTAAPVSCSPPMIKREPNSSPVMADSKINCVH